MITNNEKQQLKIFFLGFCALSGWAFVAPKILPIISYPIISFILFFVVYGLILNETWKWGNEFNRGK